MLFTEQHLRSPKSQRSKICHLHLNYHYCAWTSHIDIPILAVSGNFVAMATAKLATSLIAFQAFMHMSITYRPSYPHTDAGTRSSVVERPNRKVVDSSPIRSHRGFFFLHRSLCHSPNDILLHLNHAAEIYHFHLHHYCCTWASHIDILIHPRSFQILCHHGKSSVCHDSTLNTAVKGSKY